MLATRETIEQYIKGKVASDLTGITTPDISFSMRAENQPPNFANCLNLYFYDDDLVSPAFKSNPAWRDLTASLELLIQTDPTAPLLADKQALTACHLINQFMAIQATEKLDYSVNPAVSMGSGISWRDSYPIVWHSIAGVASEDARYIQKSAMLIFRYFEQPLVVA